MDSLIEAITELVMRELEAARGSDTVGPPQAASAANSGPLLAAASQGPRVLVVRGGEAVDETLWQTVSSSGARPSLLVSDGAVPASGLAAGWRTEGRRDGWSKAVTDYGAVVLLGSDLPTLGSIANLGAGGQLPAVVAVAAVAAGVPVFCESSVYERLRRHSARLAPGFMRTFEDQWRAVAGFGVELGTAAQLGVFLGRLGSSGAAAPAAQAKGGARDVVTTEDVEAVKRAGQTQLLVGMGAIVTPLARQQASEWGIEVKFQ